MTPSSNSAAAARTAERRRALLDIGVTLLGAADAGAVNVRAVCRTTGVTERYFYGIFGNRDDYVRAVYDDVSAQAVAVLAAATADGGTPRELATRAVDAFVALMIDAPEMGRALLLAPYREPALAPVGLGHMPDFFAVVAAAIPEELGAELRELTSIELVGALTALFTQFLNGTLRAGRDALVAHCVELIVAASVRTGGAVQP